MRLGFYKRAQNGPRRFPLNAGERGIKEKR
jgi:hypothetical protein